MFFFSLKSLTCLCVERLDAQPLILIRLEFMRFFCFENVNIYESIVNSWEMIFPDKLLQ